MAVVIALALAELVLRWTGVGYNPLVLRPVEQPTPTRHNPFARQDAALAFAARTDHFVFDRDLFWKPRPDHIVFDARGLRTVSSSRTADENAFHILALGDSNTLGWIAPDGANWPEYLQETFASDSVVVTNAGVWGYTAFQGMRRLRALCRVGPDLILISFGANDAHHGAFTDAEFADHLARLSAFTRWHLTQLLIPLFERRLNQDDGRRVPRVSVSDYEGYLAQMLSMCEPSLKVLLTRPFAGSQPRGPLWWRNYAPEYNDALVRVARRSATTVVDLHRAFDDDWTLFSDESHFTAYGHRVAAEVLYESLHDLVPNETGAPRAEFRVRSWPGRLRGFHAEADYARWTDGRGSISRMSLANPGATRLAIDTYGWREGNASDLGLRVIADGTELPYVGRQGSTHVFELTNPGAVGTLEVLSTTFSPPGDWRKLGIDVKSVRLLQ